MFDLSKLENERGKWWLKQCKELDNHLGNCKVILFRLQPFSFMVFVFLQPAHCVIGIPCLAP